MKLSHPLLALVLTQGTLLASVVELTGNEKVVVREALIDSLNRSFLSCVWEGIPRPGDQMMSSVITYLLQNDSARFYADESEVRPKIVVKRPSNYKDLNYVEMNFNTTYDQEKVEFIELYESQVRLERKNMGTIFNPRFEMVEVHQHLLSGRCDLY
ncbi:MAG: hypothetical protein WDA09_10805 [Bacteriovoracaceae bacterium]